MYVFVLFGSFDEVTGYNTNCTASKDKKLYTRYTILVILINDLFFDVSF